MTNSKTGALLHSDHMATIEMLQALEQFLVKAGRTAPDVEKARNLLARVASTIASEVDRHFGFEENELFPLFEKKGEMGIVMMLTGEHREILPIGQRVAELALGALAAGRFDANGWAEFRALGLELVEREIFHIQKEEMGLLSAISMFLGDEEDAALAERFKALEQAA